MTDNDKLRAAIEALPAPDPSFPGGMYTADMISRKAVLALIAANPAPAVLDECGRICIHVDDCPCNERVGCAGLRLRRGKAGAGVLPRRPPHRRDGLGVSDLREPRTKAGRELLRSFQEPDEPFTNVVVRLGVIAIEDEAAVSAAKRLALAANSAPEAPPVGLDAMTAERDALAEDEQALSERLDVLELEYLKAMDLVRRQALEQGFSAEFAAGYVSANSEALLIFENIRARLTEGTGSE